MNRPSPGTSDENPAPATERGGGPRAQGERDAEQAGEERARAILESISDSFIAIDHDWRFTYVNRQAERLLLRTRGELLGKVLWEEYPGFPGSEFERAYRQAAAEQLSSTVTAFYPDHDRWYEVHVYPSADGIVIYFQDVTRRKTAESALARMMEESERQRRVYETALSNSADFNYVFDLEGRFTYVNTALLALWQKPLAEALGKNFFDLDYPPELAERLQRQIQQVITTRAPVRDETPYTSGFGTRAYEYIFVPVIGVDGSVVAVAGSTRDITDRKQAEQEIRASEEQYRQAAAAAAAAAAANAKFRVFFEQGTQFAGVLTLDGTVVEANRLCLDACGFTREEVLGRPFWECGWWSRSAALMERVRAATLKAAGGQLVRTESAYFIADGSERIVDLVLAPATDDDGRVLFVAATGNDVTDRKRAEEDLKEANRHKDEFLATLAHELRNPLAPVRAGLEVMKLSPGDHQAVGRARDMMARHVGHMVRLVDDLLDLSRVSRGQIELRKERISLQAVLESALESSRSLVEAAEHELSVLPPGEPVWLDGDLTRLAQVVSNVLNNAAKYTAKRGRIVLSAGAEQGEAVIRVTDNGTGISPEMLSRVFDMFAQVDRTVDRAQGGLGIGLSLVRKLLEMHGGAIAAESDGLGRGSTFTVRLPLAAAPEGPAAAPSDGKTRARSAGRRILVVDDNEDGAETLAMMLELTGHQARTAHDGPEALDAARAFHPEVVFLDIGLPGMSGYEVARQFRADPGLSGAVLVALTGWGSEEDKRKSKEAGFDFHLIKPVDVGMVEEILRKL